MKKAMFKRSLALSALMALVITGSAYAENIDVASDATKNDEAVISVGDGESFKNAGTVNASDSITVKGIFNNTGTIKTGVLIIGQSDKQDTNTIEGEIYATERIDYKGVAGNLYTRKLEAILNTTQLNIIGNGLQTGFLVSNNEVLQNVGAINITTNSGKTGLSFGAGTYNLAMPITLNGSGTQDARLEANDGATVTLAKLVGAGNRNKLQTNGNSTFIVDDISVEADGKLGLQTWDSGDGEGYSGEFKLHKITVADNAAVVATGIPGEPNTKITGTLDIILEGEDSLVDFGGASKADWRSNKINVAADSITIHAADTTPNVPNATIDDMRKPKTYKVLISETSDIARNPEKITVIADGSNNTGNAEADLKKLSQVVGFTYEENGSEETNAPKVHAAEGSKIEQEGTDIFDGAAGIVGENGNVQVTDIKKNTNAYGVFESTANALMTWRQENDDLFKRMGELRDSSGEHGVWVRMIRGEADYRSIHNQYNTYQLGYDEKLSKDKHWTVGATLSYTDGKSGFSTGSAENTHKSIALYGSRMNDDGSYVDLIAKYGRLEHEYSTINDTLSGDYDTNGYSFSAEYGKRFAKDNGLWIEPQVQLTYGRVASASYMTNTGNKVYQEDMDSLVGRLGFRLGKNIKQGSVYARASYLYDFSGDTGVRLTDNYNGNRYMEADLGGGWWEVGIGTNINLSDNSYLYLDVEKTYGGDVATPWQWIAGVRYSF